MSTTAKSKTAAIKAAREATSSIYRMGSGWGFGHPVFDDQLNGPRTMVERSNYASIVLARCEYIANLALSLMGCKDAYTYDIEGNVDSRVNMWLHRNKRSQHKIV